MIHVGTAWWVGRKGLAREPPPTTRPGLRAHSQVAQRAQPTRVGQQAFGNDEASLIFEAADRLAARAGRPTDPQSVPRRGSYVRESTRRPGYLPDPLHREGATTATLRGRRRRLLDQRPKPDLSKVRRP